MTIIGRADSNVFGPDNREEVRWIGKPWRRIELVTHRYIYKGKQHDVTRDLTFHFGLRRLGFGITLSFVKSGYLDYGDEPNQ